MHTDVSNEPAAFIFKIRTCTTEKKEYSSL